MYVKVTFTNGVGNNLFQYFFGYLVARHHSATLLTPPLPPLGVSGTFDWRAYFSRFDQVVGADESNFLRYFEAPFWHNLKLDKCYPMDFRVFLPYMDHLKERFPPPAEVNEHDLVFHLRLGDRLLRRSDYALGMKLDLDELSGAIRRFDFRRLHIVTDMPYWRRIEPGDLKQMQFHVMPRDHQQIEPEVACDHFNSIIDFVSAFDVVVRSGHSVSEDFNFMRRFKKVLFQHGTLSWWAAAIGNAEQVGVYGPWRPIKRDRNRNLGHTPLPGWFSWGSTSKKQAANPNGNLG